MKLTNYDIYNLILFTIREERRGQVVSLKEFNDILPIESIAHYDSLYHIYEANTDNTDKMDAFKVFVDGGTLPVTDNVLSLPSDYQHKDSFVYMMGGTVPRGIDLVTTSQAGVRRGGTLKKPTERNPIAEIVNNKIKFYPEALNPNYIKISYLKHPSRAYADGYYDANDNFVYLQEGEEVTLSASETALDGSTDIAYTSQTVESEFSDEDKLKIAERILARLGVSLSEGQIAQYASAVRVES